MRARWIGLVIIAAVWLVFQCILHAVIAGAAPSATKFALAALNGVSHAALNLLLLWVFGSSLLGAREALITGFARRVHGTIPPYITTYTRKVTAAWCVFFVLQLALSAMLFAACPLGVWSFFVSVLSFPCLVCMFVGEYAYRIWRFPDFSHVSFWRGIRLFIEDSRAGRDGRAHN